LILWIEEYNNKRPHSGKYCFGKTFMQMFLDSLPLAEKKMLGQDYIDGDKKNTRSIRLSLDYYILFYFYSH